MLAVHRNYADAPPPSGWLPNPARRFSSHYYLFPGWSSFGLGACATPEEGLSTFLDSWGGNAQPSGELCLRRGAIGAQEVIQLQVFPPGATQPSHVKTFAWGGFDTAFAWSLASGTYLLKKGEGGQPDVFERRGLLTVNARDQFATMSGNLLHVIARPGELILENAAVMTSGVAGVPDGTPVPSLRRLSLKAAWTTRVGTLAGQQVVRDAGE